MDFYFDSRSDEDQTSPERAEHLGQEAARVSEALPGDTRVSVASFDRATGNPAVVVTHRPQPGGEDFVQRALDHVQRISPALGLTEEQPPEFRADPAVQRTSSGSAVVHLRQLYKGIPIYEASETVRFDPEGRLTEVAGRSHTVAGDISVTAGVDPADALVVAARHLLDLASDEVDPFGQPLATGIDLTGLAPRVLSVHTDTPQQMVTFTAPPFEDPSIVRLLWFPIGGDLRLSWEVVLQLPGGAQYRVLVDAADRSILLVRALTRSLLGAADVFLQGGRPRTRVDLPVPLSQFGMTGPKPVDWLTGPSTKGANADAFSADTGQPVSGAIGGNGRATFAPADPASTEQLVVNLFTLNGIMHDVFYALGFREADGNFQVDNRGLGGFGSDRVRAIVHPGPVWGTANMGTPADGFAPTMNMGLVERTGRHTALDSDVVYHEYTHGLSNRLVGGPMDTTALDAPQSGGMGEGWGDYFACVLNGVETVGSWVVDNQRGIRGHRYDQNFPDTFEDLGSGRYTRVHAIGELWCAALLELNRRIGAALGMQLVVDAMKLSASNPGFLAMRDAVLVAARDRALASGTSTADAEELRAGIWAAFARYGMGPGATSVEATLGPVLADFSTPPRHQTGPTVTQTRTPNLPIPDGDPRGITSSITLAGGAITRLSVTVAITHSYRGDLIVRLRAPGGDPFLLHDRAGGGADHLRTAWTTDDALLAPLVGRSVTGEWTLEVVDRARYDVGTLDSWTLEATTSAARPVVSGSAAPGATIPDSTAPGISSAIDLAGTGPIRQLRLDLDLTHTFIGDLVVTVTGPTGEKAVLHDRTGGGTDNLITSFDSDTGALSAFVGLPVAGRWTLEVADLARRDVGKLNRWTLEAAL